MTKVKSSSLQPHCGSGVRTPLYHELGRMACLPFKLAMRVRRLLAPIPWAYFASQCLCMHQKMLIILSASCLLYLCGILYLFAQFQE